MRINDSSKKPEFGAPVCEKIESLNILHIKAKY